MFDDEYVSQTLIIFFCYLFGEIFMPMGVSTKAAQKLFGIP